MFMAIAGELLEEKLREAEADEADTRAAVVDPERG
jgi:hypothetical protein